MEKSKRGSVSCIRFKHVMEYLVGKRFVFVSDHKFLMSLESPEMPIPALAANRYVGHFFRIILIQY